MEDRRCMGPACTRKASPNEQLCRSHLAPLKQQLAKAAKPHAATGVSLGNLPYGTPGYPVHTLTHPRSKVFRTYGPGPHPCLWCGLLVRWDIKYPKRTALVVDHIDENPSNNSLENLAISCQRCNVGRTVSRLHAEGHYELSNKQAAYSNRYNRLRNSGVAVPYWIDYLRGLGEEASTAIVAQMEARSAGRFVGGSEPSAVANPLDG